MAGGLRVLAILQARTGSARLPNKVMLPLEGKPVLEHVVDRVRASSLVSGLLVATTLGRGDDVIERACGRMGAKCFRGSEGDVLDRYYQAAKQFSPENVLRITCDCPLSDPKVIDLVIRRHLEEKSDYASNTMKPSFPNGVDTEVFTFPALKRAWAEAKLASEREHVTPYFYNHPEKFKLLDVQNGRDLSGKRWTIDEQPDYEFLKRVFHALYPKNHLFGMRETLDFLEKHPELEKINAGIGRNEGYAKSLREDKRVNLGELG